MERLNENQLLTPQELLDKYPDCGLNTRQIGMAVFCGAIAGVKNRGARSHSILETSFLKYIEYKKQVPTIELYSRISD